MPERINNKDRKIQLRGWLLFLISAVFFTVAGIRDGDMLMTLGGLFFLLACIVFLIPFLWPRTNTGNDASQDE